MSAQARQYYEFGGFRLDPKQRLLLREGEIVPLTPKVFETLLVLIENNGLVVTKDDLMNRVWPDLIVEERCLSQKIFLLRKALGDASKDNCYIETVPKVGYRFRASLTESMDQEGALILEKHDRLRILSTEEEAIAQDVAFEALDITDAKVIGRRPTAIRRAARAFLLAAAFVIAMGAAYFSIADRDNRSEAALKIRSIAVLPFKPLSGDPNDEYLGLGMADTLINRLSHLNQLIVRPSSAFRRGSTSEQDPLAAGREQRVEAVLEGSIQRWDERVRLTVRLLKVKDGSALWSYKCDQKWTDILALQDSISEKVAEALTVELTGEERLLLTKHHTENTEAYQLYLKGRYFWNKRTGDGFKKALDYFNQAVEKDSNYALAYVGLADSYTMLADYDRIAPKEASSKAKAAVTRALEIDDTLAEAHTSLADIRRFFDWDWAGAEQEYKRAIELNPNYATAHQWYGEFLSAMGRHDEAIREMKRAEEIDPLSVVVKNAAGWVLLFAREYDLAIEECRKVIEMDPNYGEVYSQLRRAYEQKGMYREALAADEKLRIFRKDEKLRMFRREGARQLTELPDTISIPSAKAYWQKMLELAKKDLKDDREAAQFRLAEAYAQLGERDRALELLEKAYEENSFWMPFLRVHPHLDPLRSDPRFRDLLRRLGLLD